MPDTISLAALRRHVVAHQGFAARSRRASAGEAEATIRRLACVQLDSISTVARSHRITIASRAGVYEESAISRLLGAGRVFEYWAHEACLIPIDDYPLFRWRMNGRGHWGTPYDVSADGSRIYFLRRNDDPLPREIHVVIGWRELLD